MPKLNQVNALLTGRKGETEKQITGLYHVIQKDNLFDGRSRVYKPLDEERGEKLPPESQKVQQNAREVLKSASQKWSELWDLTLTQDKGNQGACADLVVDGKTVASQVPVSTLLFLTKQLNDVETLIGKLPVPDPSEDWEYDPNTDLLKTRPTQTVRTKKVPRNHVKAEATDKHPAQVEVYHEDIQIGTWTQTLFSGRLPAREKADLLTRVKKLQDAVKQAREEANALGVSNASIGGDVFRYLLNTNP